MKMLHLVPIVSVAPFFYFPLITFSHSLWAYGDGQNNVKKTCYKQYIVYNLRTGLVDYTLKTAVYHESGH